MLGECAEADAFADGDADGLEELVEHDEKLWRRRGASSRKLRIATRLRNAVVMRVGLWRWRALVSAAGACARGGS